MWTSIVKWPKEVSLPNAENESRDTHQSERHAWAVVEAIQEHGLGGEGEIFPLSVDVKFIPQT
ncbi:hypothetical protein DAA48_21220 [Aeromonas veronii]|jgi:hypothetical protein|uniref:Uncharacterized protein n=1 Tax=Aeromonas veronii TaxID=654 RepID=A0A2T4MWK2_AERVE|nr:hypothetical protein DAA48_21220 [Aeromonas veronii]